jgi:hypothetical protein
VCLDETKNHARRAGNPGNVGENLTKTSDAHLATTLPSLDTFEPKPDLSRAHSSVEVHTLADPKPGGIRR